MQCKESKELSNAEVIYVNYFQKRHISLSSSILRHMQLGILCIKSI